MCVQKRVWCRRSLNIGRCAELQVSFDTYLLQTMERGSSEMGKGEASHDHPYVLEK
jgi:hypothetical protein